MKKILSIMIVLAMVLSLVACTQATDTKDTSDQAPVDEETDSGDSDEISFEAGKQTGKAEGHNGSVEVEVEFSEDEILAVDIVSSDETEHLSEVVFDTIPGKVVEEQSLNVDSVSGATITSAALKSAITEAVVKADGDPELLKKKDTEEAEGETVELEADLVVVGGGSAGLSAALSAEQKGLSVILLEKSAMLGGHTALSGAYTLVTGSKIQEELGVTDDSAEKAYADIMANGGDKSVPELLKLYSEKMGEATDWSLDYVGAKAPDKLTPLAENGVDRALIYDGGGADLIDSFANKLEETEVDLYLDTEATALMTDGDEVIGVEAKSKDGKTYKIKAESTVLATGSYGARDDLLPERLKDFVYYGASLADGKGMLMAEEAGADTVNMGYVELFENGVEWKPGIAKSTYNGSMAAWDVSGILVDLDGKRVVNERGPGIAIVKKQEEQENSTLFLLMDQATFDSFSDNITGYGISQEMLDAWVENNGEENPIFAKGESVEEVAETVGVDVEGLKGTIETYNEYVEGGEDKEFGRSAEYLKEEIGEGPYYLVEQKPRYATTLGGLLINTDLQVINTSGQAIKGLYSVGDTAGGVRGDDSIPGSDVGWAITSGYLIGEILAD